jgi:hypothetical protein
MALAIPGALSKMEFSSSPRKRTSRLAWSTEALRRLALGRSTADHKLLVDLLHESNDSSVLAKAARRWNPKLATAEAVSKVGGSGTLGRSHDFIFQFSHGTAFIHNQFNRALVLAKVSDRPRIFFVAAKPPTVAANTFQLAPQAISGGGAIPDPPVKSVLLVPASRIFSSISSKAARLLPILQRGFLDRTGINSVSRTRCMDSKLLIRILVARA